MRIAFATILLFITALVSYAQTSVPLNLDSLDIKEPNTILPVKGYTRVPEFPGGLDAFGRFLAKNTHYPDSARKNNIQGTVLVKMIIEVDGRITNVKALNSVSPDIDKEALHVISSSPNWIPGIQNGRPVRVSYSVPLNFDLDNDRSPAFDRPDTNPEFPGGKEGFIDFIKKNIRIPADVIERSGIVTVYFTVEKDGRLIEIRPFIATTKQMSDEALRLIYNSPKWKPGLIENRPVRVSTSVTIPFEPNH